MKLINKAGSFYKMWSNWVFALVAILSVVEAHWYEGLHLVLPDSVYNYTVAALSILGIVLRLIKQGNLTDPGSEPEAVQR